MERLGESYKTSGMVYHLKERTDRKAWYTCNLTGNTIHEVFLIPVYKAGELYGKQYPDREAAPATGSFGKTAWSISGADSYARAQKCYDALDDLINDPDILPDIPMDDDGTVNEPESDEAPD